MNKNRSNIFIYHFISLTFITTIVTQTTNLLNENNEDKQQQTNNDQFMSKTIFQPTTNLPNLSSINFKINSTEGKAFATNELWRLLSKLRIGSFFTSRARSIACECPTSSQTTLIPIPVDIHHLDKLSNHLNYHSSNQPLNNPLNHPLNRIQHLQDLKSNTPDTKQLTDAYPLMKKQTYNNEKYAYNNLNNLFLYPDKVLSTEQSTAKEILDKTHLNDLINDNGRSITSSVGTTSLFDNQKQQTNPLSNLQAAFLFNKVPFHENLINKNHLLQDNSLFSKKDEFSHTNWPDNLNKYNNIDKQLPQDFLEFRGRSNGQQKDVEDFNPTKVLNEITQLLLNEMETNYSQRSGSLSKIRILKLLTELEHFMKQNGKQWPTTIFPKNDASSFSGTSFSSRIRDDSQFDNFASNLMNRMTNRTMNSKHLFGENKKFRLSKNKPNQLNENDWNEDDEYFIDYHLPGESILNFVPDQATDFLPVMNPVKFIKPLNNQKLNQTADKKIDFMNETKQNNKQITNLIMNKKVIADKREQKR